VAIRALVENAAEAIGREGRVRIIGRVQADRYSIVIVDSGPGVPDPQKALTPFYTTKPGHFGLGLNVARRVAKRRKGDITLSPGADGAMIWFPLPHPLP
jgi:signal transduction histidine kinase